MKYYMIRYCNLLSNLERVSFQLQQKDDYYKKSDYNILIEKYNNYIKQIDELEQKWAKIYKMHSGVSSKSIGDIYIEEIKNEINSILNKLDVSYIDFCNMKNYSKNPEYKRCNNLLDQLKIMGHIQQIAKNA